MANNIKGITIKIDGDTTPLAKSLDKVDAKLKSTKSELKDVERLLKFDPGNTQLLAQKQELLAQVVEQTRERLQMLNTAMEQNGEKLPAEKYRALEREIIATENQLKYYEEAAEGAGDASEELGDDVEGAGESATDAGEDIEDAGDQTQEAGKAAEDSGRGWSILGQIIADLAKDAIKKAIDGLKTLGQWVKTSISDSAEFADEVLTLNKVTGLTTDTIQELKYSAELLDTDFETVQGSLRKLTQNMAKAADGNEDLTKTFKDLGVSVKDDVTGELRPAQDVFYDLIDALGEVKNETERDAIAMSIFGKSAQDLNPLIAAGSDGIKAFAEEAHNAGAVLDGEALEALGDMDDSFQRVNQSIQVAERNLALALAPAITAVADTFSKMAADADWQEIFSSVSEGVKEILPGITDLSRKFLPSILGAVQKILPYIVQIFEDVDFAPLFDATSDFLNEGLPILVQLASDLMPEIVDLLSVLIPVLTTILQILQPLLELIGPALQIALETAALWFQGVTSILQEHVIPALGGTKDATDKARNGMKDFADRIQEVRVTIRDNMTQLRASISDNINSAAQTFAEKIAGMVVAAQQKFAEIKQKITKPIEDAKAAIANAVDAIKSKLQSIGSGSFSLPKIKMPHLSVTGTWSFNPPRVPSFSIKWYRDAMANGMILDGATIFGMKNGQLLGGGEAGPEAIVGVNSLRQMIRDAVGTTTNNNNRYDYGGINIVVYGAPGQDVNELANIIESKINANISRRRAAF